MIDYPPRKPRKQPIDRRSGRCPRGCGPGIRTDPLDICPRCNNTGIAEYDPAFSKADDALLKTLLAEARPWPFVALKIDKPEAVCRSRASLLRIESARPDPQSFYVVRSGPTPDAPVVDVNDPASLHDATVRP